MLYLICAGWALSGVFTSVRMWTKSYNLELGDMPIILFYGVLAGPLSCLLWWYSDWLNTATGVARKVLVKRRN